MALSKDERIESLQHELAQARERIQALEAKLASTGSNGAVEERAPSIWPTGLQLGTITAHIFRRYPRLRPTKEHESLFNAAFPVAFKFLARNVSRTPPGKWSKFANSVWCDRINEWVQSRGKHCEMSMAAFSAAIIAHDIEHSFSDRWPLEFNVGIVEGGGLDPDGWRRVHAGQLRNPSPFGIAIQRAPIYEQARPTQREFINGAWVDVAVPPSSW